MNNLTWLQLGAVSVLEESTEEELKKIIKNLPMGIVDSLYLLIHKEIFDDEEEEIEGSY